MGEILPDGSIQGYAAICDACGATMPVNMQGQGTCPECSFRRNPSNPDPRPSTPGKVTPDQLAAGTLADYRRTGDGCDHEWVDPTNEVVDANGHVLCVKCGRLKGADADG